MRILTLASLFPHQLDPTYGVFILQRVKHLAKKPRNSVVVMSPVPYFPKWLKTRRWRKASELPSTEVMDGLPVHNPRYFLLPQGSMVLHGLVMFLGCYRSARRIDREAPIDCIDAHFVYPDGFAGVLLGKALKVAVVVSARGTDINVYPQFPVIRRLIQWTLKNADGVVAVSSALRERMVALGRPADAIELIPNGIDGTRFRYSDRDQAREALGLPLAAKIAISVGALVPVKRHQLLIGALARLRAERPDLRLWIFGEGHLRAFLESLARKLGLDDRVTFPGKIPNEDLQRWFAAADISCLASEREGWPNAVTESLACGTPVVATRVGGIPEILSSPELGILVDGTPESLAGGIREAFERSWDRKEIAERTKRRTWDVVAEEVEAALSKSIRVSAGKRRGPTDSEAANGPP